MSNKTASTHGKPQKEATGGGYSPCKSTGCKHSPSKYGFCSEHFDEFKFGLINKHGQHVPDYEKKWEQYTVWKKAKVA